MTWNYRLVEFQEDGDTFLSLVEMFYEDGQPIGYTDVSLSMFEDIRQIENAIGLLETALFKPVMFIDADGKIKERV